jgi:6-phosphogluconate dehydrogenase
MGANLARNAARNGATVSVFNRTAERTKEFMKDHGTEGSFVACDDLASLVGGLASPRAILIMVKAGDAVDDMIHNLVPLLQKGDMLIDGGNSHYRDTERREKDLAAKGIHFIGMGVSGGEEGALNGPSMMPGGSKEAIAAMMPLLQPMAADDGAGGKCVAYIGAGGAGHFVKMVHNGIEYGMMQLIAECYDILKKIGGYTNKELGALFDAWNATPYLRSFLIEITGKIFKAKDGANDLIDVILDKAGQKGTGKWTTDAAMHYGVAVPIITSAVDARIISGAKEFRVQRSKEAPRTLIDANVPTKDALARQVQTALELGFISAYAEGFLLLSTAGSEEKWNLSMADIARTWRGGCIIRSGIVEKYQAMFAGDTNAQKELRTLFDGERQHDWRSVVMLAVAKGIPVPALSASLASYDAYRTERLPQNLIQAQRDFFGAHGFERIDKEGTFHQKV